MEKTFGPIPWCHVFSRTSLEGEQPKQHVCRKIRKIQGWFVLSKCFWRNSVHVFFLPDRSCGAVHYGPRGVRSAAEGRRPWPRPFDHVRPWSRHDKLRDIMRMNFMKEPDEICETKQIISSLKASNPNPNISYTHRFPCCMNFTLHVASLEARKLPGTTNVVPKVAHLQK